MESGGMVRRPNETSSRSVPPKLFDDSHAFETDETETVTIRWKTAQNLGSSDTDPGLSRVRAGKLEYFGRHGESRRLERDGQRRHLFDRRGAGDLEGTPTFAAICPRTCQSNRESWRGSNSRQPIVSRESLGGSGKGDEIHGPSGGFPVLCGRTKAGARRGRRGRLGHYLQYLNTSYSQGRPVSDGELLLAGLLFFQPRYGKLGGQQFARSWRALNGWRKRSPTRSRRPLPRMIWSGICCEICFETTSRDGQLRVAVDCRMLSHWRTSAVRARGLHQTDVRRGERLDTPPTPRAPRRAEQNAKLRRQNLPGSRR